MGLPATPPPSDRQAARDLARRIVASVENDEEMPLPGVVECYARAASVERDGVEDLAFQLAQEIELQRDDLQRTYDTVCALTLIPNLDRAVWASLCNLRTQLAVELGRANPDLPRPGIEPPKEKP